MKVNLVLVLLLALFNINFSYTQKAQVDMLEIELKFKNVRNSTGTMKIQVYKDQESFLDNTPLQTFKIKKALLKSNGWSTKFSLESGVYGVAVLDDENENGEMDYNLISMPKEGYGFSDFYHTSWSRPVFSDFDFHLNESSKKEFEVKLRYI